MNLGTVCLSIKRIRSIPPLWPLLRKQRLPPVYSFDFNAGRKVIRCIAATHVLEFHYQASQAYRVYTDVQVPANTWAYPSSLYVISRPLARIQKRGLAYGSVLYRNQTKVSLDFLQRMIYKYLSIPVDYYIYDLPTDEACPEELHWPRCGRKRPCWKKTWLKNTTYGTNSVMH